jgi:hypothetical protein
LDYLRLTFPMIPSIGTDPTRLLGVIEMQISRLLCHSITILPRSWIPSLQYLQGWDDEYQKWSFTITQDTPWANKLGKCLISEKITDFMLTSSDDYPRLTLDSSWSHPLALDSTCLSR